MYAERATWKSLNEARSFKANFLSYNCNSKSAGIAGPETFRIKKESTFTRPNRHPGLDPGSPYECPGMGGINGKESLVRPVILNRVQNDGICIHCYNPIPCSFEPSKVPKSSRLPSEASAQAGL